MNPGWLPTLRAVVAHYQDSYPFVRRLLELLDLATDAANVASDYVEDARTWGGLDSAEAVADQNYIDARTRFDGAMAEAGEERTEPAPGDPEPTGHQSTLAHCDGCKTVRNWCFDCDEQCCRCPTCICQCCRAAPKGGPEA